jgi:hypothetical protein
MILFGLYSFVDCLYSFGISLKYFKSKAFCVFIVCLLFYYLVRTVPEPYRYFSNFLIIYATISYFLCLIVLSSSFISLLSDSPKRDIIRGCFQNGRLCALGNSNFLGFACTAIIMVSVCGFLQTEHFYSQKTMMPRKVFFVLTGLMGWFCLGLSGSRTSFVGIAFMTGFLLWGRLTTHLTKNSALHPAFKIAINAVFFSLTCIIVVLSLYLPVPIFSRFGCFLGRVIGNNNLVKNLGTIRVHDFSVEDTTGLERIMIWERTLSLSFKNLRHALLGITPLSNDAITRVYPGRHDVSLVHAHNFLLDILFRYGLIGLIIWIAILFNWCKAAITVLLRYRDHLFYRCIVASMGGILIMGIAESVPFSHTVSNHLGILFFSLCGFAERTTERKILSE